MVQMANEVPEGYGADSTQGCAGFRRRSLADEVSKDKVLEGSGWLMRFRKVPAQIISKVCGKVEWHNGRKQTSFRAVLVQMADEVPEGSGLDGR